MFLNGHCAAPNEVGQMPLTAPKTTPKTTTMFITIFDDTYNQPDCRSYYRMLRTLGYSNHTHAVPVFRAVLAELCRVRGLDQPQVFDFASSYGIVSALMKHQVSADAFLDRYADSQFDTLSADDMRRDDTRWLAELPRNSVRADFNGLDVADRAVDYAQGTGLFDQGFAEDIQANDPSSGLAACLAQTDLIVECGSVAHLMPRALDRLLHAAERKPWLVTSPVRGNERTEAFDVMRAHGLQIDTLGLLPFPHRRFENADEQARAIAIAKDAGHDTDGFETTGSFFAQIYVARPADEATQVENWAIHPADFGSGGAA
ncbi:MAG: hypothetical protein AB8B82_04165 [Roseovarius sp.]